MESGTPGMLNRVPLRDQVFDVLRDMIVSGKLGGGDRLNEADLASMLGISRGPLREAIQRLGAEGFVEFIQNRGAFVRTISADDVGHMFEVRELIEVAAARMAASRVSDDDRERLDALLRAVEAELEDKADAAYPIEPDLHELVLELSGNPYLQRTGGDLQNQVRLARIKSGSSPSRAREALAEHRAIIAAVVAGDGDAAAAAMRGHLDKSREHILQGS